MDNVNGRARVLVADDHLLTRVGIRALLEDDERFELVGEAVNGNEAIGLVESLKPDLVLMDVRMPELDGLQATRAIRSTCPTTRVLILSMFDDPDLLIGAVDAGAAGYISKGISESALRSAMSDAMSGDFPVDMALVRDALKRAPADTPSAAAPPHADVLSAREQEVVGLLALGHTNRQIAERLLIMPSTVKAHVEHILVKLGANDRTQAAVQALERGYVRPEHDAHKSPRNHRP
jgi:DNA-binding NarL/FixJ family response regulator